MTKPENRSCEPMKPRATYPGRVAERSICHSSFGILPVPVESLTMSYHHWRKFKNAVVQVITSACALLVIAPLGLIFYHLLTSGLGAVNWDFFTRLPTTPVGGGGGGGGGVRVDGGVRC